MKKVLLLFAAFIILASCHRTQCPAYMNGESTGVSGSKGKKKELFPPAMMKKHKP